MCKQKFATLATTEHAANSTSRWARIVERLTPVLPMLAVGMSAFLFSVQQLYAKLLQGSIPSFELVFVRAIQQILIALVQIRRQDGKFSASGVFGHRAAILWLVARGVVGFGGMGGGTWATQLLPLADAQTLIFTSPIFTLLIACIFLGEKASLVEIVSLGVSLCGAVIVTKPSFLFSGSDGPEPLPLKGVLVACVASLSAGTVFPIVRHLGILKVPDVLIVNWQAIAGFILSVPCLFVAGQQSEVKLPNSFLEWFIMSTVGPVGFAAQSFMVWGMTRERAGPASMMRLWDVLFSFVWQGMLIAGEPLHALDFLGGGLVMLGTLIGMSYKLYMKRATQTVAKPMPLTEEGEVEDEQSEAGEDDDVPAESLDLGLVDCTPATADAKVLGRPESDVVALKQSELQASALASHV